MKTHQSREAQGQSILDRAAENLAYHPCPVDGEHFCHGFLYNTEAHEVSLVYTARLRNLRQMGWEIDCLRKEGNRNLYHILGKTAVQQELPHAEGLVLVGQLPNGYTLFEVQP